MLRAEEKKTRWLGVDMRPRWRRRVAVVLTYVGFLVAIAFSDERWWGHPMIATWALVVLVQSAGVFRMSGPLRSFEEPLADRPQRWMIVNGLDEWARYRYCVPSFDEATEDQQADLLKRYRVGNFIVPRGSAPESLDERERHERDGAVRWSTRWVGTFLASAAGQYALTKHPVTGMEVAAHFLAALVLVSTLPQARVLWTERDPRKITEEMALVQNEA